MDQTDRYWACVIGVGVIEHNHRKRVAKGVLVKTDVLHLAIGNSVADQWPPSRSKLVYLRGLPTVAVDVKPNHTGHGNRLVNPIAAAGDVDGSVFPCVIIPMDQIPLGVWRARD